MNRSSMAGNKGEWSELYVFLKLLAEGRVHAADAHANKIDDIYYPIVKIMREEVKGSPVHYVVNREDERVEVVVDGVSVAFVPQSEMASEANELLFEIKDGKSSFEIEQVANFANGIMVYKLKAPSSDKTDIAMQIEDLYTNTVQDVGFSIKSELGHAPTLLNASRSTNFVYVVEGLSENDVDRINSIDGEKKIIARMSALRGAAAELRYDHMASTVFEENLSLIDTAMPSIIAEMLLLYYTRDIAEVSTLADLLDETNPLGFRRDGMYAYKIRKALCAFALGMAPASEWDGDEDANGGYIIVKSSGEVLAYHIYNRTAFEQYLLNSTRLERPSTSRHDYMRLYETGGKTYLNLNLQIRFKK